MHLPRFLVPPDQWRHGQPRLTGRDAHHLAVLRLGVGDEVRVGDGAGHEYAAKVTAVGQDHADLELGAKMSTSVEPACAVTLYQGMTQGAKLDDLIPPLTEIGLSRLVPTLCARTQGRAHADLGPRRARWREIARQAAQQSERTRIPEMAPPMSLAEAVAAAKTADVGIICGERVGGDSAWKAKLANVAQPATVAVLVGPEGGFTADELVAARSAGLVTVSLGPRILRAETAGLVAVTLALHTWGDLGA